MLPKIQKPSAVCFNPVPQIPILITSEFAGYFSFARLNQAFFAGSGRWISSPSQLSLALEVESWAGSRDIRESQTLSRTVSLGTNSNDFEHPRRKTEPAYSFVGMHCIFDECKSMVTVIKIWAYIF
ncbi:hypothetical protein R6Q57_008598 [Mikania cordata]